MGAVREPAKLASCLPLMVEIFAGKLMEGSRCVREGGYRRPDKRCTNQELCKKISALKQKGFSFALKYRHKSPMKYGYARVSTDGQSVNAQVATLRKHGAAKVFREVASGAKTYRVQLRRVIDQLDAGDVLMVTRLDRLARSTRDLLNTLAAIADRKAGFRSLNDTWADTTTSHGRLMLTVLAGLAEFERDLIRARTSEGRERAKARGVKMGRPPKLTPHQQKEAIKRRDQGDETLADIGRSYNVSAATISRLGRD
jgi:DNA invertase Pin-like site-specific DNA recombinase